MDSMRANQRNMERRARRASARVAANCAKGSNGDVFGFCGQDSNAGGRGNTGRPNAQSAIWPVHERTDVLGPEPCVHTVRIAVTLHTPPPPRRLGLRQAPSTEGRKLYLRAVEALIKLSGGDTFSAIYDRSTHTTLQSPEMSYEECGSLGAGFEAIFPRTGDEDRAASSRPETSQALAFRCYRRWSCYDYFRSGIRRASLGNRVRKASLGNRIWKASLGELEPEHNWKGAFPRNFSRNY